MPNKALVAFRVALVLGLLIITAPAFASATERAEAVIKPTQAATPEHPKAQTTPSAMAATVLTLDDALDRSIRQNPQLSAFSREVAASEFEARQAGYYPNPELSVEVENFAGSGDYSGNEVAETTVILRQQLELGGKRSRRQQLGEGQKQLAKQQYQVVRADMIAITTARFIAVLVAQQRLALADEQFSLARKVLETVDERIVAGKTARVESLRFQTLVAEARLRKLQTQQELSRARHALAALWGQETASFTIAQDYLEQLHVLPEWSELSAKLTQSPSLSYQQTVIRHAQLRLALERSKRLPDLTLSLGTKSFEDSNDHALLAGVAVSLPLFDRNQGAIGAAQVRQAKARDEARAAQLKLRTELMGAWQKLQSAHSEAVLLRDQVLPAVQQSFDAITYGYQAGKFGFLEVLDAEQTLFTSKNRYVDSLSNYHQTYAELERLLGQKLLSENIAPVASTENQRGQS